MRVLGAILAGGRSRRFGSDKAQARWRDQPLIAHVRAALEPHADRVVVCGGDAASALADRPEPGLGPLGGLAAALAFAGDNGFDRVLSVPCDVPDLAAALVAALAAAEAPCFVARLPVLGCWPSALAPALDRHLAAGGSRSLRAWGEACGAAGLAFAEPLLPANINHADDLAALVARHGEAQR